MLMLCLFFYGIFCGAIVNADLCDKSTITYEIGKPTTLFGARANEISLPNSPGFSPAQCKKEIRIPRAVLISLHITELNLNGHKEWINNGNGVNAKTIEDRVFICPTDCDHSVSGCWRRLEQQNEISLTFATNILCVQFEHNNAADNLGGFVPGSGVHVVVTVKQALCQVQRVTASPRNCVGICSQNGLVIDNCTAAGTKMYSSTIQPTLSEIHSTTDSLSTQTAAPTTKGTSVRKANTTLSFLQQFTAVTQTKHSTSTSPSIEVSLSSSTEKPSTATLKPFPTKPTGHQNTEFRTTTNASNMTEMVTLTKADPPTRQRFTSTPAVVMASMENLQTTPVTSTAASSKAELERTSSVSTPTYLNTTNVLLNDDKFPDLLKGICILAGCILAVFVMLPVAYFIYQRRQHEFEPNQDLECNTLSTFKIHPELNDSLNESFWRDNWLMNHPECHPLDIPAAIYHLGHPQDDHLDIPFAQPRSTTVIHDEDQYDSPQFLLKLGYEDLSDICERFDSISSQSLSDVTNVSPSEVSGNLPTAEQHKPNLEEYVIHRLKKRAERLHTESESTQESEAKSCSLYKKRESNTSSRGTMYSKVQKGSAVYIDNEIPKRSETHTTKACTPSSFSTNSGKYSTKALEQRQLMNQSQGYKPNGIHNEENVPKSLGLERSSSKRSLRRSLSCSASNRNRTSSHSENVKNNGIYRSRVFGQGTGSAEIPKASGHLRKDTDWTINALYAVVGQKTNTTTDGV